MSRGGAFRFAISVAWAIALTFAAPTASTMEVPVGNHVRFGAIESGGQLRQYRLYVPAGKREGKLPVVFVLHGGFGAPSQVASQTGFDRAAARHGFLAVYPGGFANTWNAGTCCGPARRFGVDDVGFVVDLLKELSTRFSVDRARVYATGMSNGGMLAYRLACERSALFAAVAPVAATMTVSCRPPRPVSILHIHGLDDWAVPYEGGGGGLGEEHPRSVPSTIGRWRTIDRCPPPDASRLGRVRTSVSAPCAQGTEVTLITIEGAHHTWPGDPGPTGGLVNPPSDAVDATAVISKFFERHHR